MNNTNKTEYPALLAALQPGQAVTILNSRIRQISKINSDIAGWINERRRIEEQYALALNNLVAKRSETVTELGVFATPWQSIVAGTVALAEVHSNFATRIEADVERPLKDQRRDFTSMESLQSNLAALAKDVEKNRKKGSSAQDNADSGWESQAPFIFEQLQSLDENRVNQTREALTQLQTHEIDSHERSKASAESSLNALLNVDTPEEVSAFVARTSSEIPVAESYPDVSGVGISSRRGTASRSDREMSMSGLAPPGAARRETDDGRSEISEHSADTPKTEKKSRFGGLRRLGTVMTRRKDKEKIDDTGKSPEKRPRRNPLRRGSSAVMEPIPSPSASVSELPTTAATRRTSRHEDTAAPAIDTSESLVPSGVNGGVSNGLNENAIESRRDLMTPATPTTPTNGTLAASIPQIGIRPPSTIVEEGAAGSVLADIERAQQEANSQEHESSFNVNIRDRPILEESSDAQAAAVANVSNALRASQMPPPQRRSGTVRGRRDVRNTMFVPNPPPELISAGEKLPGPLSPAFGVSPSPSMPSEHRGADAQSIRSSHSMASSIGPGAVKHAEMSGPGLNASIVETSSVSFEAGIASKATVIGELAFVYNGSENVNTPSSIRLDNFQVLEKVAPNPAFVAALPDRSGEYNIDLSQLSRTSVGFKYQVHLADGASTDYAPIVVVPQFRIEPTQTSVILTYHLNPAFSPPTKANSSVTLSNVVIVLNLEGARSSGCQSKPAGIYSKEKNLIYWKLGDVTLSSGEDATHKLLARFTTETEAKPGSTEVRWELKDAGSALGVSILGESSGQASSADPFADVGASSTSLVAGKEIDVHRRLTAGRYTSIGRV